MFKDKIFCSSLKSIVKIALSLVIAHQCKKDINN